MTALEYIQHAIRYCDFEETEAEKQRVKFESANPGGLAKWQADIIERDKNRIVVLRNLISIVQQYEMNDSRDDKIAAVYERVENKLIVRANDSHAHYCIEKVARSIDQAAKAIDKTQSLHNTPSVDLVIATGFLEDADAEICKYLNKYFKENNIDYVIEN